MNALWLCLSLFAADDIYFFKWRDTRGNLFVTDRIDDVPAPLREAFRKKRDAAIAKKKEHGATPRPAPTPEVRNDAGADAYQRYMQKVAREKETRAEATTLRDKLIEIATKNSQLLTEQGELRTNPVMNAAIPARGERLRAIDDELADLAKQKAEVLDKTKELINRVEARGDPDTWVTGLE